MSKPDSFCISLHLFIRRMPQTLPLKPDNMAGAYRNKILIFRVKGDLRPPSTPWYLDLSALRSVTNPISHILFMVVVNKNVRISFLLNIPHEKGFKKTAAPDKWR